MGKIVIPSGDFHIGNRGSLMTHEVIRNADIPSKKEIVEPTNTQKEIIKIYENLCDQYHKPDLLILNGDLVDGKNYKDSGLGLWSSDVAEQAEVFAELISWLKPRKIVGTSGSPYHSERNPCMDAIAIKKCRTLGGKKGIFRQGYVSANINGCRIHAMHKTTVSKSTWQYRATPIARSMVLAELAKDTYGHYNIILKSHVHWFAYVGFSSYLGMVLPCWKAFDPFGDTNIEFNDPAVGYAIFEIEDDGGYTFDFNITHFKQKSLNPDVIV